MRKEKEKNKVIFILCIVIVSKNDLVIFIKMQIFICTLIYNHLFNSLPLLILLNSSIQFSLLMMKWMDDDSECNMHHVLYSISESICGVSSKN